MICLCSHAYAMLYLSNNLSPRSLTLRGAIKGTSWSKGTTEYGWKEYLVNLCRCGLPRGAVAVYQAYPRDTVSGPLPLRARGATGEASKPAH